MVLILSGFKGGEAGTTDTTEQCAVYKVRLPGQACSMAGCQLARAQYFMQLRAQICDAGGFWPNREAHAFINAGEVENHAKSDHQLCR
eukprot:2688941-Heterocapsa_arctica.AAC.1